MNFTAWVNEAKRFCQSLETLEGITRFEFEVAAPLGQDELSALEARWSHGLPVALRDFWTQGSAHFHCVYVWTPPAHKLSKMKTIFPHQSFIYGGPRFESAEHVYPGNSGMEPGCEDMEEAIGELAYRWWCEAAVIMYVGNGDLIALDQTADSQEPPVVYLSHDDESSAVIAPSLSYFLEAWAELCFIGPEIWLLEPWLGEFTRRIDPDRHRTPELKALLSQ